MPVRDGPLSTTIMPSLLYVCQRTQCSNTNLYSTDIYYKGNLTDSWCETQLVRRCVLSQDALALLAENAELSEEEGRAVAFRRAAAVLKTLPKLVTNMAQLRGLPGLGEHSLRVIKASRQCLYWLAF